MSARTNVGADGVRPPAFAEGNAFGDAFADGGVRRDDDAGAQEEGARRAPLHWVGVLANVGSGTGVDRKILEWNCLLTYAECHRDP